MSLRSNLASIRKNSNALVLIGLLPLFASSCTPVAANTPNHVLAASPSPGYLLPTPSSLAYGTVTQGQSYSLIEKVMNTGEVGVTISGVSFSGSGFSVTGISFPASVLPGGSVSFWVQYVPPAGGSINDTMTVTSNGSNPALQMPLTATVNSTGFLTPSPATLSFGNVVESVGKTMTVSVSNTGNSNVTISSLSASGTGLSVGGLTLPATLAHAQSATFNVTWDPSSTAAFNGSVTITSNGSNPSLAIPVSGTGIASGTLSPSVSSVSFGNVVIASSSTTSVKLTNTGNTSVTISTIAASGTGFSVSGITLPVTLSNAQSASFNVSFNASTAGASTGKVTVSSNASNATVSLPLSATGVTPAGTLTLTPASANFGSVAIGNSSSVSGTLTAGASSITVSAASSNNSGVFAISGLSLPVTIAAGTSAKFSMVFSPKAAGSASAVLTFTSNATTSTMTENLAGTGVAAPTHSVHLSWNASSSSNVSGYNVYRAPYGTSCGAFTKLNTTLNTTTLFTDSTVVDGSAYCYAATAVNSSSQESSYSNIVSDLVIPTT